MKTCSLMHKRIFDIIFSSFGILILIPFFLILILLSKIYMDKGPIFFIQERVGRNSKVFKMIKFRSMKNNNNGSFISIKGEDRITPFGITIRKYKLDELPELLNVFFGDMSLVGPRPDVPGYADKLQGNDRLILKLRPGITGPASLKYSNEEEFLATVENPQKFNDEVIFPDKVKINLDYYFNRTFWGDIKIIVNTVFRTNY